MREASLLFETLRLGPRVEAAVLASAWRDADGTGLTQLADYEGGQIWILRRLRETGAAQTAPPAPVEELTRRARETEARNLLVDAEAQEVVRRLDGIGVQQVLIKGIARRAGAGRWPYASARATNDVDVIVLAADAQRAWDLLAASGYHRHSDATSPHHLPGLIGGGRVGVELHTSLAHTLAPEEAWRRATIGAHAVRWQGADVRIPCATEMLWHGLSHSFQTGDLIPWRLRYFLDGAAILASDDRIDWVTLARRLDDGEIGNTVAARRWLGAAAQLAGIELPAEVAARVPAFDVARALRWRLGVFAHLRHAGLKAHLLEEGTRVELGVGLTPAVSGAGPFRQVRRRLAGRAARVTYGLWRTLNG